MMIVLEWDDACEGLDQTIALEKDWEAKEAQWGKTSDAIGWEATPPESPALDFHKVLGLG
jgi:hypothetical protein